MNENRFNEILGVLNTQEELLDKLDDNKVVNVAYTQWAFDNDTVEGTLTGMNQIPGLDETDLSPNVRQSGFTSQASSLPRRFVSHIFGRTSYNLNKLVQITLKLGKLIRELLVATQQLYKYDTQYRPGDIVTIKTNMPDAITRIQQQVLKSQYEDFPNFNTDMLSAHTSSPFYTSPFRQEFIQHYQACTLKYRRISQNPEFIQGIDPVNNPEHWVIELDVGLLYAITFTDWVFNSCVRIRGTQTIAGNKYFTPKPSLYLGNPDIYPPVPLADTNELNAKANINSPTFTGTPTTPTPPMP